MRCADTRSARPRERAGATVIYGGIHATLYPDEARDLGGAHAVVSGDGDVVWPVVIDRCRRRARCSRRMKAAASKATTSSRRAGICCRKAATCGPRCRPSAAARSIARSARCGAPTARSRGSAASTGRGRRSSSCGGAASGSSRSPTTISIRSRSTTCAWRSGRTSARLEQLRALRAERFALMASSRELPQDMVFFTQITMEAAEDADVPRGHAARAHQGRAGRRRGGHPRRAEGRLQGLQRGRRGAGRAAAEFREHGVHVLGSFIFGLPGDRPSTFDATPKSPSARNSPLRSS